jgi:hypothetical protein
MSEINKARIISESIAVLVITAASAFYFSIVTSFWTYASGVPGGVPMEHIFVPTPLLFLGLYLLLVRFSSLKSKGPGRLIIATVVGVLVQFVLSGIAFVCYRGFELFLQEKPGFVDIFTSVLLYAFIAATLSTIFWAGEDVAGSIINLIRGPKLP